VDELWEKVQDTGLQSYLAALKVAYQRDPRDYKMILQDIASKVASKKKVTFASRMSQVNAVYTREGETPKSGIYTADGSIFIGIYDSNQWKSAEVKKHHKEILEARSQKGGGIMVDLPTMVDLPDFPKRQAQGKCNKETVQKNKKLKAQLKVSATRLQEAGIEADEDNDDVESDSNAGNSFGGKNSKKKKDT